MSFVTKYVSGECRQLARTVLGGAKSIAPRGCFGLSIVTTRARVMLQASRSKGAFARAAFANALSRTRLATLMPRVILHSEAAASPTR